MKRFFAFFLALLMLAILVSCGETPVAPTEAVTEPTTAVTTPTEATTAATEPVATEPPHVHAYTVLNHDETGHWYECPDDGEKTEIEAHIWDEGTVTKEPTYSEGGEKTYVCSVCGEVKIEQTPKITAVSVKEVDCEAVKSPNGKLTEYHVTYEIKLSNYKTMKFILNYGYYAKKAEVGYINEPPVYLNFNRQEAILPRILKGSDFVASFELLDSEGKMLYDGFSSWGEVTGTAFDYYYDFESNKNIKFEGVANAVMHPETIRGIFLYAEDIPGEEGDVILYLRDPETFELVEGAQISLHVKYNKMLF